MKKQCKSRYHKLTLEFEEQLQRPLTKKEKDFIIWLVKQEWREKHDGLPDFDVISTLTIHRRAGRLKQCTPSNG